MKISRDLQKVLGDIVKLLIQDMWSPDLDPPSAGRPDDLEDFRLLIQVALLETGRGGTEVFDLTVASPSKCSGNEPPVFIAHTLILRQFSWELVNRQVEKLLLHCSSAGTWDDAIRVLGPYLRYSDG